MAAVTLPGCQRVDVLPAGFREPPPLTPIRYGTYSGVLSAHSQYAGLALASPTYEDLLEGLPGHVGGVPPRPYGYPVKWGLEDERGVEWWLTDAEGLTDSANWTPATLDPARGDGTWLLDVRAPGREVTLTGMLVSEDRLALLDAVSRAGGVLAAQPRTGWVTYRTEGGGLRRLPVALAGATRTRWTGPHAVEVQMSMRGVDVGSPGAGAYMEGEPTQYEAGPSTTLQITVDGVVPTPPVLVLRGPMPSGSEVIFSNGMTLTTTRALTDAGDVTEALTIDCRTRQVWAGGWDYTQNRLSSETPDRGAVTWLGGRWATLGLGYQEVTFDATTGTLQMTVVPLW